MSKPSNKKLFGITLKNAKTLCEDVNGRLPRVGYYMEVKTNERVKVYHEDGNPFIAKKLTVYLSNDGRGKFRLWSHYTL